MAYRDDLGALRSRLTNLEQERAGLRAKRLELDAATARLDEIDDEVAELSERLAKERRLPMLQGLSIASPCPAEWGDMVGDERVRFCCDCHKNVYNVIELTQAEAEALIIEHEGDVCMRLHQRRDGTVLTADCPVGRKRKRRRRIVAGVVIAVSSAAGMHAYVSSFELGDVEAQAQEHSVNPNAFERKTVQPPRRPPPPRVDRDHDNDVRVMAGMIKVPPHLQGNRPRGTQPGPYPPFKKSEP